MDQLDPAKPPVYSEKEIDETLQTGDSKLLGGEMRLRSHWVDQ